MSKAGCRRPRDSDRDIGIREWGETTDGQRPVCIQHRFIDNRHAQTIGASCQCDAGISDVDGKFGIVVETVKPSECSLTLIACRIVSNLIIVSVVVEIYGIKSVMHSNDVPMPADADRVSCQSVVESG